MSEHAVVFGGSRGLVGIVTDPADTDPDRDLPTVVLLNAGLVHRVGPNRLHVQLARRLAADGNTVLRFDFSGVGDSAARWDAVPFEKSAVRETRDAMDYLAEARGSRRFVLIAICSGAAFAVRAALEDHRVDAVVLINAAGHRWGTDEELSRTMLRHYRRMATFGSSRGRLIRKLLTLDFDGAAVIATVGRRIREAARRGDPPPAAPSHVASLRALAERRVDIRMLYSEADEGLDYYRLHLDKDLKSLEAEGRLVTRVMAGANHTFTLRSHQRALLSAVAGWVRGRTG